MTRLELRLFGAMQVMYAGVPITAFGSDKARALLAYLAIEADRPHRREALAGLLWPDYPEASARHSLSQTLLTLRQALGDAQANPPFFRISRDTLQFTRFSEDTLDVVTFVELLAQCERHTHQRMANCNECAARLETATALYQGSLLQGFFLDSSPPFEEWLALKREWLHQQMLSALGHLTGYYEQRGAYSQAQHSARRQLELDPWREEAHRQLMRIFALSGQRSAALAQFETCRQILHSELGIAPGPETVALYEQIRAVSSGLGESPRAPTPSVPSSQVSTRPLPIPPTPFIGREDERGQLAQMLADPKCRLITLVGPGGIGKTRLALQGAVDAGVQFEHGVAFVALAPLNAPAQLVPAIADALGFSFYGQDDPFSQLGNYLREKHVLLLLDNLEHLIAASDLLATLLEQAPRLKLLVTSRERLRLRGEWVMELKGLVVPTQLTARTIEQSSAVALFVQSAQRVRHDFAPTTAEQQVIVQICRLVAGMPLGIELAASWVRMLALSEIAAEIASSLDFLSATLRDVPERHRSFRAVFDSSWKLLTPAEQQALLRLAVFQGGFERAAADHVAGATLHLLSTLVDKSLLRRTSNGRYDMHELVRQYASARLHTDPDQEAALRQRHCAYYATFVQQHERNLISATQRAAVAALHSEPANLRYAWEWAVAQQQSTVISQMARGLFLFYELTCRYLEGATIFQHAAAALELQPTDEQQAVTLGQVLAYQGHCSFRIGQHEPALALLQRSRELLAPHACHAAQTYAEALLLFAIVASYMGDYALACQLVQEGRSLARHNGYQWINALLLTVAGRIAFATGNYAEAQADLQESLRLCRALGDPRGTAFCLNTLGMLAQAQAEYETAQQLLQESLTISSRAGDSWAIGGALNELGLVAYAQHEYTEAHYLFRESLGLFRELGDRRYIARALMNLGRVSSALGAQTDAWGMFREALAVAMGAHVQPVALEVLTHMAVILAQQGQCARAHEILAHVRDHPAATCQTRDGAGRICAELATASGQNLPVTPRPFALLLAELL